MKRKLLVKRPNRSSRSNRSRNLSARILRILGICVATAVIVTAIASLLPMNSLITKLSSHQAVTSVDFMKEELKNLSTTLEISAKTISLDQTVIDSLSAGNHEEILKETKYLGEALDIDNIVVTDTKGTILSSTSETDIVGSNISGRDAIQNALSGDMYKGIGKDENSVYAANASSPVFKNGAIIGAVYTSYNLDNTEFVDNLKELTGDEFTIFAGDTRINTTLVQDGKRVVGTTLDPKIANVVINEKQEYTGKAKLFGKNFITAYYPIMSDDGKTVTGVMYSGMDHTEIEKIFFKNIIIISIIAIISIIIDISIIAAVLKKGLKTPIEKVVKAAKAIETGEVNNEVLTMINEITSNDEIGMLARSMEGAVNSVQLMSSDISMFHNALISRDLTMSVDKTRHGGIYREIMNIVENLFSELGNILKEIKVMADGIENGSSHVSSASQSLAQGSTEQASATEELSSTIENIAVQISENAASAETANSLSMEAGREVRSSSNHMNEMVKAMDNINSISKEIGKIIKTIDDIAFQTNILALNAAVEAARAGVHGKGFAVVADEVRNLANKSAEAAKSTALLIENSITAVDKGSKIATETEQALHNVVTKTSEVNSLINEIAEAAQKQREAISQIHIGIDQISGVVNANSASSEETAAASEELSAQAQ
ncbi:MAG: tap1, partial [Sedimentibacter sp.]|nr:tap1 [Sedimentibacter sp.]